MKQKKPKRKRKVLTKGKSYPFRDSVFYKLNSKKRLAEKILGITLPELKRLRADNNYRCYNKLVKGKLRYIEEPKDNLDKVHTRVASLLSRLETFDGLHSGRKGRSNLTNARAHLGKGRRVITADIKSFYQSTDRNKVFDFFYNTLNCKSDVADLLSHVLTIGGHIPTGSRVSMPLSYFSNFRMFDEMRKIADGKGLLMTIFVDDLTFSGTSLKKSFIYDLEKLARKHGHLLHPSKTRYYRESECKLVTGAVLDGNSLKPRNKHMKELHLGLSKILSEPAQKGFSRKVMGRFDYIASIDPKFRDRARTFRSTLLE